MPRTAVNEDETTELWENQLRDVDLPPVTGTQGPFSETSPVWCPFPRAFLNCERVPQFNMATTILLASRALPAIHPGAGNWLEHDLPSSFGVVDLFAGPGGLGEGFASLYDEGHAPYRIGVSVESESSAHRTLRLRAFLREFRRRNGSLPVEFIEFHAGRSREPDWAEVDAGSWHAATDEAWHLELGSRGAVAEMDHAIRNIRRRFDDTLLIGGPPCQAYSLVGRARARGTRGYVAEEDERHYLFREYIRVLDKLRPAAFVMENVKGMLSSTVESRLVFEMLIEDLSSLGTGRGSLYELRAIAVEGDRCRLRVAREPSDFVVRAEEFGIPQRRHRVFIIGLRTDVAARNSRANVLLPAARLALTDVIGNLPALRSGLSRGADSREHWESVVRSAAESLAKLHRKNGKERFHAEFSRVARGIRHGTSLTRSERTLPSGYGSSNDDLRRGLERAELNAIAQHETRGHMASDLSRYLFASVFGRVEGSSPKADRFPPALSPRHRNWNSGVFSDRFRVQLAHEPSTTVTSHISKDGHYYIHYDPMQCRSLTVREVARLQTFPDDYLFLGNRTQQYVQVGNAVPPYLARTIALLLFRALQDGSAKLPLIDEDADSEIT